MGSRIPIFPLHTLLLPTVDLGIHVFEPRYRDMVAHSLADGHAFGVVLIKHGREVGGPAEPQPAKNLAKHLVGTLAQICGYAKLPDGRYLLEVEGAQRFRIHTTHDDRSYPTADVSFLSDPIGHFGNARAASLDVARLLHLYRARSGDADLPVHLPVDPVARSYLIASLLHVDTTEKQRLLETGSAEERLFAEREILQREITLLDHLRARRS